MFFWWGLPHQKSGFLTGFGEISQKKVLDVLLGLGVSQKNAGISGSHLKVRCCYQVFVHQLVVEDTGSSAVELQPLKKTCLALGFAWVWFGDLLGIRLGEKS